MRWKDRVKRAAGVAAASLALLVAGAMPARPDQLIEWSDLPAGNGNVQEDVQVDVSCVDDCNVDDHAFPVRDGRDGDQFVGGGGETNNDTDFTSIASGAGEVNRPVPEPGTLLLLAAGLTGVGVMLRRRA